MALIEFIALSLWRLVVTCWTEYLLVSQFNITNPVPIGNEYATPAQVKSGITWFCCKLFGAVRSTLSPSLPPSLLPSLQQAAYSTAELIDTLLIIGSNTDRFCAGWDSSEVRLFFDYFFVLRKISNLTLRFLYPANLEFAPLKVNYPSFTTLRVGANRQFRIWRIFSYIVFLSKLYSDAVCHVSSYPSAINSLCFTLVTNKVFILI